MKTQCYLENERRSIMMQITKFTDVDIDGNGTEERR